MALLVPGDLGCDVSGFRLDTPQKIADAKAAGCKFVLRYSAGIASDPGNPNYLKSKWKLITPDEFKQIVASELDIIANDEWYETRITEGYAAGVADGKAATALWKSCGLAKGATVYCSWDSKPSALKYWKVRRYLAGWIKGSGGYYVPDLYAGTPALKILAKKGWRPNAGSWSNDGLPYQPDTSTPDKRAALVALGTAKTPAHIWQTGNYWFQKNADENLILRVPVGSHLETLAAVVPPKPKPTGHLNVDAARALLLKTAALYKHGKVGIAVRNALKALKGIK